MEIKVGDRIRIYHLKGEDRTYDGAEGVVEYIDGIGQLHGTWGGLAVIPDEDDSAPLTMALHSQGGILHIPGFRLVHCQ